MSTIFNLQPTLELETRRCYDCGTYWAIEKTRSGGNDICPRCASEKIDRAMEFLKELERSRNSLKGALTHQKNKKP